MLLEFLLIKRRKKKKMDRNKLMEKTDFVVSWHAKKYNRVIFRIGNLNKEGCRTWEQGGKKYMCFWDTVLERYTTCIDPMITYRRGLN